MKRIKVRLKSGKIVSIKYYTQYSNDKGVFVLWERGGYKKIEHKTAFREFGEQEFKEL